MTIQNGEILKMEYKKENIQIRIENSKKEQLRKISKKKNVSISELMINYIDELIEQNQNGKQLKIEFK